MENNKPKTREVLQEDRYLWMARAFSVVALLSIIANICMLFALTGLTPLLRVQPFLIRTQSKDTQAITITRPSAERVDSKTLQYALAREYIINRYTITSDVQDMIRVWGQEGPVMAMSNDAVYRQFYENEVENLRTRPVLDRYKDIQEKGLTQTVEFMTFTPLPVKREGIFEWEGRIKLKSMTWQDSEPVEQKFCVWMRTYFAPETEQKKENTTWAQRFRNPLGFKVVDFGLAPLGEDGRTCQWPNR